MFKVATITLAILAPCAGLAGGLQDAILENDPMAIATATGVCGPAGVASATALPGGQVEVVCNSDATAFVPLIGGLGPAALGLGAAALAAAVLSGTDGGGTTPDTQ